jgi:hypothetical protein
MHDVACCGLGGCARGWSGWWRLRAAGRGVVVCAGNRIGDDGASDCLHRPPPLGSPLAIPTTHYSPARNRPNPQPATTSSVHSRRSQTPAHSAAATDVRSVRMTSSHLSCVILSRLGASDASVAGTESRKDDAAEAAETLGYAAYIGGSCAVSGCLRTPAMR